MSAGLQDFSCSPMPLMVLLVVQFRNDFIENTTHPTINHLGIFQTLCNGRAKTIISADEAAAYVVDHQIDPKALTFPSKNTASLYIQSFQKSVGSTGFLRCGTPRFLRNNFDHNLDHNASEILSIRMNIMK